QVITVPEQGWAGIKNGELLKLASSSFDAFITIDQNLTSQQNLQQIDLIIIVFVHTIFLFWLPLLIEPICSLFYHPFDWPWQL
ncbi:MAG: hypothetical protein F6K18_31475, partial [Okeania sp. SIO2C2]|nr:hypothetical protein [Okeania sp. SIO2C2]